MSSNGKPFNWAASAEDMLRARVRNDLITEWADSEGIARVAIELGELEDADLQAQLDEINTILREHGIEETGAAGLRKMSDRLGAAEGWADE
jgi:hypothetical protein